MGMAPYLIIFVAGHEISLLIAPPADEMTKGQEKLKSSHRNRVKSNRNEDRPPPPSILPAMTGNGRVYDSPVGDIESVPGWCEYRSAGSDSRSCSSR